jgi:hypothetical protein
MKIMKVIGILVAILILGIAGLLTYVKLALPNIPLEKDLKVELTPARVERGKYLANHVSVCMDCHSTRVRDKFAMPLQEGTFAKGGEEFNEDLGFPGKYYSKNLTPSNLGSWSDAEIFRAMTSGVSKDGHPLFPIMPYTYIGKMDREDVYSIIAYIRTLKADPSENKESVSNFPMNFIIHLIPQKPNFTTKPDEKDIVKYGAYVANQAGCVECHTPDEKGQIIPGKEFQGNREFMLPTGGFIHTSNITQDIETGIGKWTEEQFVRKFKQYADSNYKPAPVDKNTYNTFMPWSYYAGMKETDLKAIFAYLKTIKPVSNKVDKFTLASIKK